MNTPRIIGITRVSQEGDREIVHSYGIQAEHIRQDCERANGQLLYIGQERNVSGGSSLANRPELLRAVQAVESGTADMIVAAYFDRFFRSLEVQAEVVGRVERAGGEILTLDHGKLTNGTPATRLQANIVGAMSQFFREQTAEKSAAGQAAAVERGATPWARVPLGYVRKTDGTLEPDPQAVPIVQRAFAMRLEGASAMKIRAMLKAEGVIRSHRGVQVMLGNRIYLGEIHFGTMVNLTAHDAIVDPDVFRRVQELRIPRGRQPSVSPRLLSRLGVLRCGSCGSRLSTMKLPRQNDYPIYRCSSSSDCARHVTISAVIVEEVVSNAVRDALRDAQGRASMAESAQDAARALETAQGEYDAALRVFSLTGAENETAAVARIGGLRQARDDAQSRLDQIGPEAATVINANVDWEALSLGERRDLIRATVESVIVAPSGRGAERVAVNLLG